MNDRELDGIKDRIAAAVDERTDALLEASHQIHGHPELGFEEHFAHKLLTDLIESEGITVVRGAYDMPTAFAARAGNSGPTIAVFCEYDALPTVGHACGHNIIATAGLGAGLAAATVADELGGQVLILGSPAEEGGGGKVFLAERGALDGVDAALMVHPAGEDLVRMDCLAIEQLWVEYRGQSAHAAAFPHKGRNALDAAVLGYMNVAALRQHIAPGESVHGIFTSAGDRPNIVPEFASAQWYVRSPKLRTLEALKKRVFACLDAGAVAADCEMTHEWKAPAYADLVPNQPMIDLYVANAERLGRTVLDPSVEGTPTVASSDIGNVSYLVPTIHPMIKVAPSHLAIHEPEFATYAGSAEGDAGVVDGAKALAMTIADLWARPDRLAAAKAAFTAEIEAG